MIRILHVFGEMNIGGAETMLMNLYRNIDRNIIQFDFMVHTQEECAYDNEILKLGGKIYRVPKYRGINHLEYIKKWRIFLKEHKEISIIHSHVRSTAIFYLYLAKTLGFITISHSHSTSVGKDLNSIFKSIFQLPLRFVPDYFFACSLEAGKWLFGDRVCKGDKFYLIKNSINSKKFTFNNKIKVRKINELNLENNFVIGHIGRFEQPKNHEFLFEIFYYYLKLDRNSILLLVGDGSLLKYLKNKAKEMEIEEQVKFLGIRDDINELLWAMDIFVFPSLWEGLPLTLIEAQASGLKCIISDTITNEVDVTKKIIFLSLKKTAVDWAKTIFSNKEYLRKDTSKEIIDASYDIEKNVKFLEQFYLNIIAQRGNNESRK